MTDTNEFTEEAVKGKYRGEIETLQDRIDTAEEDLERRKELLELREEMIEAKKDNRDIIEPRYAYENDDAYREPRKRFDELHDELKHRQDEQQVARARADIEELKQQLKQTQDKLDEMEGDEDDE